MRLFTILAIMMIATSIHGQSFQLQYSRVSINEIHFEVSYEGPQAEIILPERGRLLVFDTEKATSANNRVFVSRDTTGNPIRFTYSFITGRTTGFGSVSKSWFPTLGEGEATYAIISENTVTDMIIFPYLSLESGRFNFTKNDDPQLLSITHSVERSDSSELSITLFNSTGFKISLKTLEKLYHYFVKYFGTLDIKNIVVINNQLISPESFVKGDSLFILIPSANSLTQLQTVMTQAWAKKHHNISPRIFGMFTDAVMRFNKFTADIGTETSTQEGEEVTQAEEEVTQAEEEKTAINDLDSTYILPVGTTEYYQNLLASGFSNNTTINVNAEGMVNNFGFLHMIWSHLGAETFLTGLQNFFSKNTDSEEKETEVIEETTEETTEEEGDTVEANESTETKTSTKEDTRADHEKIDWSIITQDKLNEPYFSLYTKEVFKAKSTYPELKALGTRVSRNSFFIPDLSIQNDKGETVEIKWNNFRIVNLELTNGSYDLDPERKIPQFSIIGSSHTFDQEQQQEQRAAIYAAERYKASGERNLRQHLGVIKLTAPAENSFKIQEGTTVYVVVSHILSSTTGFLKDAFKESIIAIDPETKRATHIATRLKI